MPALGVCPSSNTWSHWYRPSQAADTRDPDTFGVPSGCKTLLDRSIVADAYFETASAWETAQRLKVPECVVSHFRPKEGRMEVLEQKRKILIELLVKFVEADPEMLEELDVDTLCAVMSVEEKRDEILA